MEKGKTIPVLLFILFVLTSDPLGGQNLENIKDKKPVEVSGTLSATMNTYSSNRDSASRNPFSWTIAGSPTISVYGISFPFSFVLSSYNRDFRQPFNQFGASPKYKWLTLHLGYRNIVYSKYTLAGHTFLGAGVDLNPSVFRMSFMYGRFLKSIRPDTTLDAYQTPAYQRLGYAARFGIGNTSSYLDLIFFKAKDDTASLNLETPVFLYDLSPQENLALGLRGRHYFFKKVLLDVDFGVSAITRNIYADTLSIPDYPLRNFVKNFYQPNVSTQFLKAGEANLSFTLFKYRIRTSYKRIEPEYRTLGSYYFTNDLENTTVSIRGPLFKRKINIGGTFGFQRNNLFGDKTNNTFRRANSFNITWMAGRKIQASARYSNIIMEQVQNDKILIDVVDSLKMQQFANTIHGNISYNFGSKTMAKTLTLNVTNQTNSLEGGFANEDNSTSSLSSNLAFRFRNREKGSGINSALSLNTFNTGGSEINRYNFTLGANKAFFENTITANMNGTYGLTTIEGFQDGSYITLRSGARYSFKEKHAFNLSLSIISRNSKRSGASKNLSEFLLNIGYSYAF